MRVGIEEEIARVLTQTDWRKVRENMDREEEGVKAGLGGQNTGTSTHEAYRTVVGLLRNEWTREVTVCSRSKRWRKRGCEDLRRQARKDKGARTELRRKIKEAKAKCWREWIEGGKDVWWMVRVA